MSDTHVFRSDDTDIAGMAIACDPPADEVPVHIFRSGSHPEMTSGRRFTFSDADIAGMASVYDPAVHEAPVVIGHPSSDAPAYGWIKSISAKNGNLVAQLHQLDPAFCELLSSHRYKKVSASFYAPYSPGNPVPGRYYLRHVGFLGATPPAVKGLKQIAFAEGDDVVEFSDWQDDGLVMQLSHLLSQAEKKQIPDNPPQEKARSFSEGHTATPKEEIPKVDKETETETLTRIQAENDALKKQVAAQNAAAARAAADSRHAASVAFAEQLISEAKLAPAGKGVLVAVLDALSGGEEGQENSLMYAEGSNNKPLAAAFCDLLTACTPVLHFAEVAGKNMAATLQTGDLAFAEADPSRLALHNQACGLAKSENMTYEAAVKRLIQRIKNV